MNTKILMAASAFVMGIAGILMTFLPAEIAEYAGVGAAKSIVLIVQIMGAMYFGFAMLNWMAKENLIGGIYSRPVTVGNLTHFTVGALALVKAVMDGQNVLFWIAALIYSVFAICFGIVLYTHPAKKPPTA